MNAKKEDTKLIEENKKLVEEYPFLIPRNRWTDNIDPDYNYNYTELDAVPKGWKNIALNLCKELKKELEAVGYLHKYRISQIKEKYGYLRWYDFCCTKEGHDVIEKYCEQTKKVCINCGKSARWITTGWIAPYCNDCIKKVNESYVDIDEYYKDETA